MTTFVNAIKNQTTTTVNGMAARKSTADACVDLFFKIGASRGKDIIPQFVAAYVENRELALRIAQWARDVRGGAGERELFRQILAYLDKHDPDAAKALLNKVPEIGRWDDIFVADATKEHAFNLLKSALQEGNGLAAKWTPRKGVLAAQIRNYLGWTPKFYRKTLVGLTDVVEQKMCAKEWAKINFSHVPSVAAARYKSAFYRNAQEAYSAYVNALVNGESEVKVNAGAVYPYQVIQGLGYRNMSKTETDLVQMQWESLENFVGDANILPMVDVSGSMYCDAGRNTSTTCLDVAVSLGLYLADKNKGKFKDAFLTFSSNPSLEYIKGNIVQKVSQMKSAQWGMSTNLERAFKLVLKTAKENFVPNEEMPETVLILSDMQFDSCTELSDSAIQMIQREYEAAGYKMPQIVFWNLNAYDNVPVKLNQAGVALVSGFSPSIMKAVLSASIEDFTPEKIMLEAIMSPRYDI